VFDQSADAIRRWDGLRYLSKHGDDLQNWTIFEPASPDVISVEGFDDIDPDLEAALAIHRLTLG
jgi:hypothetical protein